MDIQIKKAKLAKNGCVEATYVDYEGNEITLKGNHKCHADLKIAFAALVPFFADLTEQREANKIDWYNLDSEENENLLHKIDVTGISIGGDTNNKFITLTGRRTLSTSKILNLNSPGIDMGSETLEWDHVDEFDLAVMALLHEVEEYIINKKWAVAEPSLFDENPDDPFAPDPTNELPDAESVA
ncbi:MAG: hypothetical protein HDS83_03430 [Bacteroidales bacterium]|nr:hypothetical protein [Bacteroidales bacterium]